MVRYHGRAILSDSRFWIISSTRITTPKSSSVNLSPDLKDPNFMVNVYYDFIITEGLNKIANHPSNSSFNHSTNAISIKDSVASNSNNSSNKKDNKKAGNDKPKSNNNSNNNKKDKKQKQP
ncbi:hypothetical protein N7530_004064 [Penicillium desertorum]|uniref:Uncharacterized protein n=1 Tax=Penicillium desertorum TaxID=1303715 RepID=A0A9W9WXW6_9EURO|nr:hypothetical protein N7530_004064 [Penicillium desertorum]